MEIILDFNGQNGLVNEINEKASALQLENEKIPSGSLIIFKYKGNPSSFYELGKYIGGKGYNITIASK